MDMISDLPEFILHDIMSRLPHQDSARITVLSKSWRQTRSTLPILVLVLDESRYYQKHLNKELFMKRNSFYKFVDKSLLRFHNQCLNIKQLKLSLHICDHTRSSLNDEIQCSYRRIDYWMELARECRVEVLSLTCRLTIKGADVIPEARRNWHRVIRYGYHHVPSSVLEASKRYRYHVPSSVLEAKSLVELSLDGLISLDQAFLNHSIRFSSLKVLSLTSFHFADKQVFQNLLTSCPLIEYITLDMCYGIDSVCIHGLSKLKVVKLVGFIMKVVEIDAPSLQKFHCNSAFTGRGHTAETQIKIDKCINLDELSLTGLAITHQWFLQHYYLFTTLEILELRFCTMPSGINMSCFDLKVIKLERCGAIFTNAFVPIYAPKLEFCSYIYHGACHKLPIISSSLNGSRQLEISVTLTLSICNALDYWTLKTFFLELPCKNVLATLSISHIQGAVESLETDLLRDFPVPPPVIKHLHLHASFEQIICFPLVACLLWSCRPSIISCGSSNRTIIKVLYEALMSGKKEECFCSSRHIKCWWYDLKDVKVTYSSGIDGNEISVDCETFLDALPTLSAHVVGDVSFRLE